MRAIPLILRTALMLALVSAAGWAAAADRTAKSADGVPIHYRIEGQGAPALVFVHGWCCDGGYWQEQMRHFASGHTVVAIDLAGHGASGLKRAQWTMEAFGQDVQAVVEQENLTAVVLVGHSMGGAVIAEAALAMPDRVVGLVGVDNFQKLTLGLTQAQIDGLLSWLAAGFPTHVKTYAGQLFTPDTDPALAEEIAADLASAPAAVGLGAMRELLAWYEQQPARELPRLPAPLLCINSDRVPTDTTGIRAVRPDFTVRTMPGGHFLFREDPATFDRLLTETLADLAAGSGDQP